MHQDLYDLAARQHGVVAHDQVTSLGVTRQALRTLTLRSVLVETLPGVYRVLGAPTSTRQRQHAVTLWLPGSLISHRSAADLLGLRGFDRAGVEVVVERWSRRHRPPDVLVHETKDLVAADVHQVAGLACTTMIRTLVDLPAVTGDRRAGDAIDQAHRRDASTLRRLRRRHLEVARRGRNGTTRLRRLLADRLDEEQVDSPFERLALALIVDAALPRPVTQHRVIDGSFTAHLDLAWPEQKVAVECDSFEHHSGFLAFQHDRERRRRLVGLGWTVLEFTWDDVARRPAMVAATLRRHLSRQRPSEMA